MPKTKEDTFVDLKQLAEKNDEHVRNVDNGIVFIARQEDLKLLSNTNVTLFADGTFQYSPKHFKQMLTIFVFSSGFYIPVCHFLLQNKLFSTYKKSLDMLYEECKKLGIELNVTHVMLDFEAGLIKAFRKAMPDAVIQGCRFHLGQSWWRNMEKFGLASHYKKAYTREGRWLRRCFSLKLLPATLVKKVFDLSSKFKKSVNAKKFEDYLRKNYIEHQSQFPPSSWAGLTFKTTNNGAESFHRHFGDLFGYLRTKPNIWEFLRTLSVYNQLKDTKIISSKATKEIKDFWTIHVKDFESKKISAIRLLDNLSHKSQPKTVNMKKKNSKKLN